MKTFTASLVILVLACALGCGMNEKAGPATSTSLSAGDAHNAVLGELLAAKTSDPSTLLNLSTKLTADRMGISVDGLADGLLQGVCGGAIASCAYDVGSSWVEFCREWGLYICTGGHFGRGAKK